MIGRTSHFASGLFDSSSDGEHSQLDGSSFRADDDRTSILCLPATQFDKSTASSMQSLADELVYQATETSMIVNDRKTKEMLIVESLIATVLPEAAQTFRCRTRGLVVFLHHSDTSSLGIRMPSLALEFNSRAGKDT